MNKEFVNYTQALALKELGFDEPCFSIYYSKDKSFSWHHHKDHTNDEPMLDNKEFNISAPLYQQAFRWFREKYDLYHVITIKDLGKYEEGTPDFQCAIYSKNPVLITNMDKYKTYEEAELECLKKLIELVKLCTPKPVDNGK